MWSFSAKTLCPSSVMRSNNVVAGVAVIMADKVVPVVKAEEEEEDLVDPQEELRVFHFLALILLSIIDILFLVAHNLNLP